MNLALADAGVVTIALSMIVGPLAHVAVLASGKLGWNPLGWFLVSSSTGGYSLNTGSEGLGNLIGTVAALLLLVLTLTSNDWSQRRLGVSGWKFVQQLTYTAFVLVALHSVIFLYGGHQEGKMPPAGATAEGAQRVKPGATPADGATMRPEGGYEGGNAAVVRWAFWGATLAVVGLQGAGFLATVRKRGLRAEA